MSANVIWAKFVLDTNKATRQPQWQFRKRYGEMSILYIPERNSAFPNEEGEVWLCLLGRVIYEERNFMIQSVTLLEKMSELEVLFSLQKSPRRGLQFWGEEVRRDVHTIVLVDDDSESRPQHSGEAWRCAVRRVLRPSDAGESAIITVEPLELLSRNGKPVEKPAERPKMVKRTLTLGDKPVEVAVLA